MVGSTTGVPQNRGLQLGEEQAPLISLPDSRQPETADASYSLRLPNAGRRYLQIPSRPSRHKCLSHRLKSVEFISRERSSLQAESVRSASRHPAQQRLFQLVPIALGWQRQELVILVSALAQSLLNFASVAAASDRFLFCARRLLANP
jgi:hypothetical protein